MFVLALESVRPNRRYVSSSVHAWVIACKRSFFASMDLANRGGLRPDIDGGDGDAIVVVGDDEEEGFMVPQRLHSVLKGKLMLVH